MSLITENIFDFELSAKHTMVSMAEQYLDSLRSGDGDCGCKLRKAQRLSRLIKSIHGYIPEGQYYTENLPASAEIDFSALDIASLADGMRVVVSTQFDIDGDGDIDTVTLADFIGDFLGVASIEDVISEISSQINTYGSGWSSTNTATSIIITSPTDLGSTPNSSEISIQFQPYYQFTKVCLAVTGTDVGAPGWTGIGVDDVSGYVYAANEGGDKKLYTWNGTSGTLDTPAAATSSIAQVGATTINKGLVFRPLSPRRIFVGSTNFSPPAANVYNSTPTPTANSFITPAIGTKILEARMYGTVDDYIYFGGVGVGIRGINPDNPSGPVLEYATGDYSGIYIYNPRPWVQDPTTGNVWCTGGWSNAGLLTNYGFVIVTVGLIPSYNVITTGSAPSGRNPSAITYIPSTEMFVVIMRNTDEMCFYDYAGNLVSSHSLNSTATNIESIVYDSQNDKIIIGKSDTSVEIYNSDGTFYTNFNTPPQIEGTCSHLVASPASGVFAAVTNVVYQNLFMAKMELTTMSSDFSALFYNGVSQSPINGETYCLTDGQARSVYDKIKQAAKMCEGCYTSNVYQTEPHNVFGALTGEGTLLVDDSGTYIVDESGNYILQA